MSGAPPLGGDTIAAIATPRGRGALAMVRLTGPGSRDVAARVLRPWHDEPRSAWLAGVHDPEEGELLDRGVALVYHAPSSYTGEDMVEITVHGGELGPVMVFNAFLAAGARQALPGEFTRRAVLNGRMDLLQAEAVGDLVEAGTRMMHRVAVRQVDGSLSQRIDQARDAILELESLIAYDIDFPEEDEGPVPRERIVTATDRVLGTLDALLATANTGEVIRSGAAVVIAGPPNAGKSSLFNALVGATRAIVTEIPGTTRDALEAVLEVEGWPVRLVDTAGLRPSVDVVERLGIEVSERWLERAHLVLACTDGDADLQRVHDEVRPRTSAPVLMVRTKADLNREEESGAAVPAISVSAITGEGLAVLGQAIATALSRGNARPDDEAPLLVRERHRMAVNDAREEMARFRQTLTGESVPPVVGAVHLRAAVTTLEELIGAVDVEDVLDRVFGSFCIGK